MYQQQQQRQYRLHQNPQNPTLRSNLHLKPSTAPGSTSIITDHPLALVVVACISLFVAYLTRRLRRVRQQGRNIEAGFVGLVLSYLIRLLRERNGGGSVRLDDISDCEIGQGVEAAARDGKNVVRRREDIEALDSSRCEMEELGMGVVGTNASAAAASVASQKDNEDFIELHEPSERSSTPRSSSSAPDYLSTPISSSKSIPPPPPPHPTLSTLNLSPNASPQERLRALQDRTRQCEEARFQNEGIWHMEVECLAGIGRMPARGEVIQPLDPAEESRIKLENLRRLEMAENGGSRKSNDGGDREPEPEHAPLVEVHKPEIEASSPSPSPPTFSSTSPSPPHTPSPPTPQIGIFEDSPHAVRLTPCSIPCRPRIYRTTRKSKRASVGLPKSSDEDDEEEDIRINGELVDSGSMQVKGVREVREDFDMEVGAFER